MEETLKLILGRLDKLDDIQKDIKTLKKDVKSIKTNIDKGVYEDLERIKARLKILEEKVI